MDINDLVLTDKALSVIDEGTWVDEIKEAPGLSLLVCGIGSKAAQKALELKQAQQRAKNRGKALDDEQLAMCMRETLAEVVLKGWKGLKEDGQDLPFDAAKARGWLLSRHGERFANIVLKAAQRVDEHANQFAEEVGKNS